MSDNSRITVRERVYIIQPAATTSKRAVGREKYRASSERTHTHTHTKAARLATFAVIIERSNLNVHATSLRETRANSPKSFLN